MRYPIELRYADTDQIGTIYFARHLMYVDEAITKFFKSIGIELSALEKAGVTLVVAFAEISYKKPLRYGEICEVDVVLEKLGNTSITFSFQIYGNEEPKSYGKIVYVFVNKSLDKIQIPDTIREKLEKYLKGT